MSNVEIPHFAFPFQFGRDGAVVVLDQGSHEEIEQNVKVLVRTELGERLEVPDFGVPDPTFSVGIDTEAIAAAAQEWDSRADVVVAARPDALLTMVQDLLIQVEER